MYDEYTDTRTSVKTSNLNDELGQVCNSFVYQTAVYLLF